MRRRLHLVAIVLFVVASLFNLIVWGAVPALPDVGAAIENSARKEALLASTYITLGSHVDRFVPALGTAGAALMTSAASEAFAQIGEDPNVAMDLILTRTFNRTHGWLKTMYWATPILLALSALLWARKPKKVSLIGRR